MIRINDSMMTRHLSFHWKRKSIPKINRQLLAWLDIRQQLPTKWIWNEFFKTISVIVGKNNFNDILKWWCFCDHQKNSNAFITDNFDLLYFLAHSESDRPRPHQPWSQHHNPHSMSAGKFGFNLWIFEWEQKYDLSLNSIQHPQRKSFKTLFSDFALCSKWFPPDMSSIPY